MKGACLCFERSVLAAFFVPLESPWPPLSLSLVYYYSILAIAAPLKKESKLFW